MIDKQEKILEAALKLIVEYGFHGTPTSKIAQDAGVANGTLFHYYKTKDELIIALYEHIKRQISACVDINDASIADPKERYRKNYLSALNWSLENTLAFRFLQQFMSSPYLMLLAPEDIQKESKSAHDSFRQGIKEKILKPMPVELLNSLLTSHLNGVGQYILNAKLSAAQKKKIMNDSFEMLWDMIT